jgi:glycosyltransferase involved in cell wall biosynthesis
MKPVAVMQVTDTLAIGGAERIAVSFANALPRDRFSSHLYTTRASGPLAALLQTSVGRLELCRRTTLDINALVRARSYILEKGISVLHAHGTALYFAVAAAFLARNCLVVWHAHYGRQAEQTRAPWPLRAVARRVAGVMTVSQPLAEWARTRLGVPTDRVWCVPNFVVEPPHSAEPLALPGTRGKRIVCIANLRPEKDHLTLLDAMKQVVELEPAASLLLVGGETDPIQASKVKQRIQHDGLAGHVFLLGSRDDVGSILSGCDIGVLSSASEGMPLVLLEYGMARLATVATSVGQVSEVLGGGRAGVLVPPGQAEELAMALLKLLKSAEMREKLGGELNHRVREHYSEAAAIHQILQVYESVVSPGRPRG